jgi:hypothetical protein
LYDMTFDEKGGLANLTFLKKRVAGGAYIYEK